MMIPLLLPTLLLLIPASAPARAQSDPWVEGLKHYRRVLAQVVDENGLVRYADLLADPKGFNQALNALSAVTKEQYDSWSEAARFAFLANAYNAFTLKLIIDHYPIATTDPAQPKGSIRQIPQAWKKQRFSLFQSLRSLDQIEHEMIRKSFRDPRLHFVLVCAAKGCPKLKNKPFEAATLEEDLKAAAQHYLKSQSGLQIDRNERVVRLSSLFDWYGEDWQKVDGQGTEFQKHGQKLAAVLRFIAGHVDQETASWMRNSEFRVRWIDYDWNLNDARPL